MCAWPLLCCVALVKRGSSTGLHYCLRKLMGWGIRKGFWGSWEGVPLCCELPPPEVPRIKHRELKATGDDCRCCAMMEWSARGSLGYYGGSGDRGLCWSACSSGQSWGFSLGASTACPRSMHDFQGWVAAMTAWMESAGAVSSKPCRASTLSPLMSRNSSAMTTGPLSMGLPEPLKIRPGRDKGFRRVSGLPVSAWPPAPHTPPPESHHAVFPASSAPLPSHMAHFHECPCKGWNIFLPLLRIVIGKALGSHPDHWPGPRLITNQRIRQVKEGLHHPFQPSPEKVASSCTCNDLTSLLPC